MNTIYADTHKSMSMGTYMLEVFAFRHIVPVIHSYASKREDSWKPEPRCERLLHVTTEKAEHARSRWIVIWNSAHMHLVSWCVLSSHQHRERIRNFTSLDFHSVFLAIALALLLILISVYSWAFFLIFLSVCIPHAGVIISTTASSGQKDSRNLALSRHKHLSLNEHEKTYQRREQKMRELWTAKQSYPIDRAARLVIPSFGWTFVIP